MIYKIKRVFFGSLKRGEDLYESLLKILNENDIRCGAVFAIGALDKLNIGYYELKERKYVNVEVEGLFELTSGIGNITVDDQNNIILHMHITVQNSAGDTYSGHLLKGNRVGVTVEYIILEFDGVVERKFDEKTGLKLIP